jgi:predicted ester cyclase
MTNAEQVWQRYARIWSSDEARRSTELQACVDEAVRYADANASLDGVAALSAYMGDFQAGMPGCSFRIDAVLAHHERSISFWSLIGPQAQAMQKGTSFARHTADGRLADISGFFGAP